ncbi:MAG: glycosyltransferase family 39 protein [Candidatus Obscuribacterales bacterium]|nr:glycosyltransferase family 39 protein [Candidatus Obscuribacterales bacterium]
MSLSTAPVLEQTSKIKTAFPRWSNLDWRIFAVVAIGAILLFFPALGLMPIMDPSDGYYSEGAREMFESGNYLVPHLNYVPWFEKPILIYWLISLSYKIFGVTEFAARFPAALSATALITLSYPLNRQYLRRRAALLSTLVLASSALVLLIGHIAVTDMPLCLLFSMTVACLFLTITKNIGWTKWLAYVALGIAVLCKGPMAGVLVFVSLFAYIGFTSRSISAAWQSVRKLQLIYGALIVAAISLPWFIAVTIATNGEFYQEFFIRQNIGRALGTVNHQAGPLYYVPVYLGGFFPWSIYLLAFIPSIIAAVKRARLKCREMSMRSQLIVLSALIAAWMYPFFTIVSAKLTTYILPMFPAMAILVGTSMDLALRRNKTKLMAVIAAALTAVMGVASIVAPMKVGGLHGYEAVLAAAGLCITMAFLTCTVLFLRKQNAFAVWQLSISSVIVGAVLVPLGLNVAYDMKMGDYHSFVRMLSDAHIVPAVCGRKSPSANFYLRQPVTIIEKKKEYISYVNNSDPTKPLWIIMAQDRIPYLTEANRPGHVVETRGRWSLAIVEPAK